MPELSLLQVISYTVNSVFILQWLLSKMLLHKFLVGRWEGTLAREGDDGAVFHCTLYVAAHKDRDNTAVFCYQKKDLHSTQVCIQGVDILADYDGDLLFVWRRSWKPTFIRAMHVDLGNGTQNPDDMPKRYTWNCRVSSLFFRPKMAVDVKAFDVSFSGFLARH
jgi:hypothetical protein